MTTTRRERSREQDPVSVPQPVPGEPDLVVADTTWGQLQPIEVAPGVRTVGELEVIDLVDQGATLVDCRTPGSFFGVTIRGSVLVPHDEVVERRTEFENGGVSVLFCNGPQCPQSPDAVRRLLAAGVPASALAYYRGGMQDWICAALPTQPQED